MTLRRCAWATNDLNVPYHDTEWGVPVHDDRTLFEFLILEGAQAGLSWDTILGKRERYRKVFCNFDPAKVAKLRPATLESLLQDPGIIRNRLKVFGAVRNAKAFLDVQKEFGSFDAYVWRFKTADALSTDLKRRGFTFVGSTICYAFMQAVGMVNDHAPNCFRRREVSKL